MKYLLISLFVVIGVGASSTNKPDGSKGFQIDINNTTYPSGEVTEVNPPSSTPPVTSSTTTSPTTTTTTISPTTATTPKPTSVTTASSSTIGPTNGTTIIPTSTVKPPVPTTAPAPEHHRRFDGPSFVGGIVLALGLVAIGFVAFKFYKARTELNYHTL